MQTACSLQGRPGNDQKESILMTMWGETPDVMPYTPRFDLWYNANSYRGTLSKRH